jgi:hypothetical protein
MRLMGGMKYAFDTVFRLLYRFSEMLGLVPVWNRIARMDPYIPGPGYSLIIADQYFMRDNLPDASRLVRKNILAYLGRVHQTTPCPPGKKTGHGKAENNLPDGNPGKLVCLKDLYSVMEALNVKAFLAFGTLLGHVRENGFIRNDGDLDIGIEYAPSDPDRIADALARRGFRVSRRGGSSWPCRIKCVHANGAKVDVIFFYRRNGKFHTYCEYKGRKIFREREGFGLQRADFHSTRVWIPEKPEAFLDENYLDWKVPQAKSHSLFTSALTDYKDDMIRYFALRHLYALLRRRKREHFEFFLDLFLSRNPSDPNWPEIQKAFQAKYAP